MKITFKDGAMHEFYAPTRRGDPDSPLSDTELSEKYRELAEPEIGAERSAQLEETVWALETLTSVADLYPAGRAAAE